MPFSKPTYSSGPQAAGLLVTSTDFPRSEAVATVLANPYDVPVTPVRYRRLVRLVRRRVREISPGRFAALTGGRRPLLIDVREFSEWRAGRVEGSIHLPRGLVELRIEHLVPDVDTPLVCYCADGSRSILVAESLRRLGYRRVRSLAGGFAAWESDGLPVIGRVD